MGMPLERPHIYVRNMRSMHNSVTAQDVID